VVRLDWRTVRRMPATQARRFAVMRARGANESTGEDGGTQLREQVAALPPDQARQLVAEVLRAQIAHILHLSPERIDLDKSVIEMGMDSLMGMELGLAVQENFQVKLPMMAVSEGGSVMTLAARVVASIQHENEGGGNAGDTLSEEIRAMARIHAVDPENEPAAAVNADAPAPELA
jgi:acyl carrier protein